MGNTLAIYRKELRHYFVSPVAYIVVALFIFLSAWFFNNILSAVIRMSFEQAMQGMRFGGGAAPMDVPSIVLRNFFGILSSLLLFLMPALTMGLFAEERKRGTMELLMTSPISDGEIVLGKFFASLTLFVVMLVPTAAYQIFMYVNSEPRPPWRMILVGYLGVLLLGSVLLSLGSFISSLTENQLISAILTFALFLILWVIGWSERGMGGTWSTVMEYLSVTHHYDDFGRGVIDTSGLIFFFSLIVLGIFLTMRSIDSMRWRRA